MVKFFLPLVWENFDYQHYIFTLDCELMTSKDLDRDLFLIDVSTPAPVENNGSFVYCKRQFWKKDKVGSVIEHFTWSDVQRNAHGVIKKLKSEWIIWP